MVNYGPGVSRVLSPDQQGLVQVIWQEGRPPLDSEMNLIQQMANEWSRVHVLRGTPSGWLGNADTHANDFVTNPTWSNWFQFGKQRSGERQAIPWAVVNGWLIPVTGTRTGSPPGSPNDAATWNKVALDPPPSNSGDSRIDFVFLEAWLARIAPNPATANKPAASAIYRYGNVEGGYSYIADDMQDPEIGFETSQRVQLQYRIRVVSGLIGLSGYPDGFDPAVVKGQGAANTQTNFVFENMRKELGDPGLWRAGDGTQNGLGTVDGYTYAIPICAVFRRNSVAWDGDPFQNLNGAFNRNPTAVDRTGVKTFSTAPALAANLGGLPSNLSLTLNSVSNISLPSTPATPVYIQIDDEVMAYSSIGPGTSMTLSTRGAWGTKVEAHKAGAEIKVVSGRPDGLFADQIAKTDILDLRHVVNPNGFDYQYLLRSNLDALLRGKLRAGWKRSGGGPQGSFILYQDKIGGAAAALGVTQLDNTDNLRQVYSDAAVIQKVEVIVQPPSAGASSPANVGVSWGLTVDAVAEAAGGNFTGNFEAGDSIRIPISQFKNSMPGADSDQVRFVNDSLTSAVVVRNDGSKSPIPSGHYTVSPTNPGPEDDLVITFTGSVSAVDFVKYITIHVLYGPGRGLSRRPDSIHSLAHLNPPTDVLTQRAGLPLNNLPMRAAWAPLWSKYRHGMLNNLLPVTAEAYVDPGSKTVILSPFRRVTFPSAKVLDGTNESYANSGLMPLRANDGVTLKWSQTDPLGLFSGQSDPDSNRKNIYVVLPRHLIPTWGAVRVPILHTGTSTFSEGVNFLVRTVSGVDAGLAGNAVRNFVPFANGDRTFSTFSTWNFNAPQGPADYNAPFVANGVTFAGIKLFTDSRGLGRKGLELPPFYGIARLFAVYEAQDYNANGSAYSTDTRQFVPGRATNLLRQNFDGDTFWIELDQDGDSTFILNAAALDLSKSPNPIASFEEGHYVIEANIFGFDRGSFDPATSAAKILLTRERAASEANSGNRATNLADTVTMFEAVIPGPPPAGHEVAINYSRAPYQGDAWGSQGNHSDIGHKPGSISTANAYQLLNSSLDQSNLTRPNQKPLEVLASVGFMTTLGTGRLSGDADFSASALDFRRVGYEPFTAPSSPSDSRPVVQLGALTSVDAGLPLSTEYHGCTERLPLGALFRDKDFLGTYIFGPDPAFRNSISGGLIYMGGYGPGVAATGVAADSEYEQSEIFVGSPSLGSGQPGEVLVHVDGEQGNYSLLNNFRTNRGGSVYVGSGAHPGGEMSAVFQASGPSTAQAGVLCGVACLVRNTVTHVGANEVSAGEELLLLIATTAARLSPSGVTDNRLLVGTNGTGEGYSAVDVYRIAGHPLVRDNTRSDLDPATITLSNRA